MSWRLSFDVRGLVAEPGRVNGHLEHIYCDVRGDKFERLLLFNAGEGRDMRCLYEGWPADFKSWKHGRDLPPPGQAHFDVEIHAGRCRVLVDGKVWCDFACHGEPRRARVGGGYDRVRDADVEVRNVVVEDF